MNVVLELAVKTRLDIRRIMAPSEELLNMLFPLRKKTKHSNYS